MLTLISVVVPAHNEESYLTPAMGALLDELRRRPHPFEVLICENGSLDATAQVAAELAAANPEVRVEHLAVADYGRALRTGFERSNGEVVVNFDVDYVDVGFLDRALVVAEQDKAAIVVGSKRASGAQDQRSASRRAVTAVFSLILRHGFGLGVSDTHGLKLLVREPLEGLVGECRFGRELFDTELILRAERAGLVVQEIPVTVAEQRPARTPITRRVRSALVGLVRLRLALWAEARGARRRS